MNSIRPKRNLKFKQGIFICKYPEKYTGTKPIIWRSSYELKYCRWCDHNPSVLTWGSESVVIPYPNPLTGRTSRYFVDFNVTIKDKEGNIKKYLIEIKPSIQTLPPKATRNTKSLMRRQAEYIKNRAKWSAAEQYAKKQNKLFTIITEKHLGL
jgi:hypothetical protein